MRLIETSTVHHGFRITLKRRIRARMDVLKVGDIVGFYEVPEGILLRRVADQAPHDSPRQ